MKKTIAILIAVMLVLAMVPMTAYAAEDTEMIPVVVSVPDGWDAPHAWAWADDGTNAFAAWPGEEMEVLEDGWYYIYVPSFVQNVIVNANQDTDAPVQTDGIVVEAGKAAWITVAEDNTAAVSYDALTGTEVPAYVEKFVVHAYVPLTWETVNMWAWSAPDGTNAFEAWPGEAMAEGEDGWFTGKAPTWVNSLIINGNEGSVQTADITIEGKELWITVYEDLTYELSYEDPEKAVENVTVYAQVPEDWADPCCWAWSAPDGTNAFASWPGEALTRDGDWYTIEVPGWINSVIINGNEGSVQTADLPVEAGKDIWVVVTDAENAAVSYEEPAGEAPAETAAPETEAPAETEAMEPVAEETKGSNTGLIVGIAIAAVVLGGAAIVIVKKKKK